MDELLNLTPVGGQSQPTPLSFLFDGGLDSLGVSVEGLEPS